MSDSLDEGADAAMSTHDGSGGDVARVTHASDGAGVPARFDNPGLPPHQHRLADTDPHAAKNAERQVAALFTLSIVGTLVVLVGFFAIKLDGNLTQLLRSNLALGLGLFLALFGIGAGAVHWAKTLMPDEERTEDRHPQRGSDEDRAAAVAILKEGSAESGLGRRPLIRNTLIGALALVGLPGVVFLRDVGPLPGNSLSTTMWRKGMRLMLDQPDSRPVKASDLTIGSVVHIMPEGIDKEPDILAERAKSAVLLVRLYPEDLAPASQSGSYQGIVAFSKICTHMGCPVALYEQQTHHLLCPCHQSTFDLTEGCKVIFGPAKRPLPQLPITVDDQGYLVATDGFDQPVGPSFWERG